MIDLVSCLCCTGNYNPAVRSSVMMRFSPGQATRLGLTLSEFVLGWAVVTQYTVKKVTLLAWFFKPNVFYCVFDYIKSQLSLPSLFCKVCLISQVRFAKLTFIGLRLKPCSVSLLCQRMGSPTELCRGLLYFPHVQQSPLFSTGLLLPKSEHLVWILHRNSIVISITVIACKLFSWLCWLLVKGAPYSGCYWIVSHLEH